MIQRQLYSRPGRMLCLPGPKMWCLIALLCLIHIFLATSSIAQPISSSDVSATTVDDMTGPIADRIEVEPRVSDAAIAKRLNKIMASTGWFTALDVQVKDGVVFLDGRTREAEFRAWAAELASRTSDVVAVVNRIQLEEQSPWELTPAWTEINRLWQKFLQKLPGMGLGVLVLSVAILCAITLASATRRALAQRLKPLLRDVAARAVSIPIVLLGLYLMLQIGGLSGLAATVVGGTGLVGLVAGIAFREILENYLASILISLRNPFKLDDLVEIAGHTGIVQRVTTRGTVLMNLDGNHVQIPNAMVYKSIILNFTANPNRRETFIVGIGYENEASTAQKIALHVLVDHPAVLQEPEPLVLVDRLGAATVDLQVSFWYEGTSFNGPKVRSSVIRLVKRAFEEHGISMPDEAREVVFPQGVPVQLVKQELTKETETVVEANNQGTLEPNLIKATGEGDFSSEDELLRKQARQARNPEEGADLLNEKG